MKHELQFNDGGADWCIHCGTFSCYLTDEECSAAQESEYDMGDNGNFSRVSCDMFGNEWLIIEQRQMMAA